MPSLTTGRHRIVPGRHYDTPKEVWGFRLDAAAGPPDDLARGRVIPSVGGWHAVFSQWVAGYRVHRAYVTVHLSKRREAYLIKNRAVPRGYLPAPSAKHEIDQLEAQRLAIRAVARGRKVLVGKSEQLWFPRKTKLRPAFKFRVQKAQPLQEWIVYVDVR